MTHEQMQRAIDAERRAQKQAELMAVLRALAEKRQAARRA
jgi:hypothetical protein